MTLARGSSGLSSALRALQFVEPRGGLAGSQAALGQPGLYSSPRLL